MKKMLVLRPVFRSFNVVRSLGVVGILIILIFSFELYAIGAKKFVKKDWVWCRDRESHPGQQCCDSISTEPLEIPMLGAVNTEENEVYGFGHNCTTTCDCNTILPEIKCKITKECAKVGPYFRCNKGQCQFPCLITDDCEIMFGKGFICSNKFCIVKPQPK